MSDYQRVGVISVKHLRDIIKEAIAEDRAEQMDLAWKLANEQAIAAGERLMKKLEEFDDE